MLSQYIAPTLLATGASAIIVAALYSCCYLASRIDNATTESGLGIASLLFVSIVTADGVAVYHFMMQYNLTIFEVVTGLAIGAILFYSTAAVRYFASLALDELQALTPLPAPT